MDSQSRLEAAADAIECLGAYDDIASITRELNKAVGPNLVSGTVDTKQLQDIYFESLSACERVIDSMPHVANKPYEALFEESVNQQISNESEVLGPQQFLDLHFATLGVGNHTGQIASSIPDYNRGVEGSAENIERNADHTVKHLASWLSLVWGIVTLLGAFIT